MHALLKTRNEQPFFNTSGTTRSKEATPIKVELSHNLRRKLLYMHVSSFDWKQGGLQTPIKFLDRDSIEYALTQAASHDRTEENMARLSLDAALNLIDPVWGGIYQFSTGGDWLHPHYSKTMAAQAGCLRLYSLAYGLLHELRYLTAARQIYRYMIDFLLSPEHGFYAGQDDVVSGISPKNYFALSHRQRLRLGQPNIDINLYARENAWAIEALASFFEFTGEESARVTAIRTGEWLLQYCHLTNHGYKHALTDQTSLLLGDNLAAGRAMLQLYRITGETDYLTHARNSADFIGKHFKANEGGFNTRKQNMKTVIPAQQIDENISTTRFLNLLSYYTNKAKYKKLAKHGLRYLVIPQVATARMEEAGILLAEEEFTSSPMHITIHGSRTNNDAKKLLEASLHAYGWYKIICWPSSASDIQASGSTTKAYATIYNGRYQSDRIFQVDKLTRLIKSV